MTGSGGHYSAGSAWTMSALPFLCAYASMSHAEPFTPPQGCEGYLTVQSRSCLVMNYFTCEQDAPGEQHYVVFGQSGYQDFAKVDREFQWLEFWNQTIGEVSYLLQPAQDPASFSELLATGADSYDFNARSESGIYTRYTGQDALTGQIAEIDGIKLEVTEFNMIETLLDGSSVWRGQGREYISREWRLFFGGMSTWNWGDESGSYDLSPVTFTFPGEEGFFTTEPHYDCDPQMAWIETEAQQ